MTISSWRLRHPGYSWAEWMAEAEAGAPLALHGALESVPQVSARLLVQEQVPETAMAQAPVQAYGALRVPVPLAQPALGGDGFTAVAPVAAAAPMLATASTASTPLTVRVAAWPDQAALPGVTTQVVATPAPAVTTTTGGLAVFSSVAAGPQVLQASLATTAVAQAQADATVNLQDVVGVLRLIAGAAPVSPWARKAADFDGNGAVTLADALGVLRHSVGLGAPRPGWVFYNGTTDEGSATPAAAGAAGAPVSTVPVDVAPGVAPVLVGVLRGDVDGSLAATRFGLQAQVDGSWAVDTGFGDVRLGMGAGDLVLSVPSGQAARLPLADARLLRLGGNRLVVDEAAVDLSPWDSQAGLTGLGALAVGTELRLTLPQWQQALGGGAPLSGQGGGGVMRLVITTPQEALALRQMLEDTVFVVGEEPVVAVSVAVDAGREDASALAAAIDATLRAAAPALSAAVGRHVPVTLSTDELLPAAPPTLTVAVQGTAVSFGGTADGTLFVQVDASGRATFSRASRHTAEMAASDTVVTGLFAKSLVGVSALAFTLGPSDGAVQYVLDAPQARTLVLGGSTGAGADEIVLRIVDARPGVFDDRPLHLDSAGLGAAGDTLTFRFDESARNVLSKPFDNDAVTLTSSSHVNAGFSRLKVVAGIVDASLVGSGTEGYFPPQKEWEVSSGVTLSLAQLQETRGVISPSGSGALLVALESGEQADLQGLLTGPDAPELVGVSAAMRVDGALSDEVWDFPAAPTASPAEAAQASAWSLAGAWADRWGWHSGGGDAFLA